MADFYVQYGCGTSAPSGWLNFDASPRLRLESVPGVRRLMGARALFPPSVQYGDIIAGLPLKAGSAKGLFCSHVLEHLFRDDVPVALRNSFNVLRPGGIFRLVVPDLGWRTDQYISNRGDPDAAEVLHHQLHLRPRERANGVVGKARAAFGLSMHQWMYDEPLLTKLLAEAGFVSIRRASFGDCEDPYFALVEEERRFVDDGHPELALQCYKPLDT